MEPETIINQALKGKYEIQNVIGKGGMATVYKAIQNNLNRPVALKIVHQNLVHDDEFIRRFIREAQVCASMNHANIVKVYDVGSIDSVHYMAMEYLEGESLRDKILKKDKISTDDTVHIISSIADALEHMHRKNTIHRDVKSSNIFVTTEGRPVLMDFGIVFSNEREILSRDGNLLGTPEYMSPEQAEGNIKLDSRSDIYSLGVVMYECLTGKLPVQSDNFLSTLNQVLNYEPPTVTSVNPLVPKWLGSLVTGCMVKNRNNRIQSAAQLSFMLHNKERFKFQFDDQKTQKIHKDKINDILHKQNSSISHKKKQDSTQRIIVLGILITGLLVILIILKIIGGRQVDLTQIEKITPEFDSLSLDSLPKEVTTNKIDNPEASVTVVPEVNAEKVENDAILKRMINDADNRLKTKDYEGAILQYHDAIKLDPLNEAFHKKLKNAESLLQIKIERETAENVLNNNLSNLGITMILVKNGPNGDYYISSTEITQNTWRQITGTTAGNFHGNTLPVESISWSQVMDFIQQLNNISGGNFRLPSNREWEFAARGGNQPSYSYSGGNMLSEVGWYEANSGNTTHPVRQKQANAMGLYDMSGNVWEWCSNKTIKGGSWMSPNTQCNISNTVFPGNDQGDYSIGFRICRSVN